MADHSIEIDGLGKRYRIAASRKTIGSQMLQNELADFARRFFRIRKSSAHPRWSEFWALRDVSLTVERGEVLGLIGHNGAGKSTLLKILCRVVEPTEGSATLRGRVGSLLEVGTGFHAELTGRENIFLSGAILGMPRARIQQKFDEIVAFAEIDEFLDTPVKRYSSGMYVRLGFAIAAHLEPEILLVDEVLAVGDEAFRRKCLGRLGEVSVGGRTVIFVSHNMAAIEKICDKTALIERGRLTFFGETSEAIHRYLSRSDFGVDLRSRIDRKGTGEVRIVAIQIRDDKGRSIDSVGSAKNINVCLHFEANPSFRNRRLRVTLLCRTHLGVPVFSHHNELSGNRLNAASGLGTFVCRLERLPLPPSTYRLGFRIEASSGILDAVQDAIELVVVAGDFYETGILPHSAESACLVEAAWRTEESEADQSMIS